MPRRLQQNSGAAEWRDSFRLNQPGFRSCTPIMPARLQSHFGERVSLEAKATQTKAESERESAAALAAKVASLERQLEMQTEQISRIMNAQKRRDRAAPNELRARSVPDRCNCSPPGCVRCG